MKSFVLGFVAAIVLSLAALVGLLRLGAFEVRADVHAPAWQSRLFHYAVRAAVRRRAPRVQSPVPHDDAELLAGGKLYLNACAGCHGNPGGPPQDLTEFMPSPEFAHVGTAYSEPELFWIIQHGIRRTGMSAYATSFKEREVWSLAEFVKRMNDLPPPVLDALRPKKH
jgi:mono/diheme cytochrome c family protein